MMKMMKKSVALLAAAAIAAGGTGVTGLGASVSRAAESEIQPILEYNFDETFETGKAKDSACLLYTSPSPRD